jgi:hypothetical protein
LLKYIAIFFEKSDHRVYVDAIILTSLEKNMGLVPNPELYKQLYESSVFIIYTKLP